MAASTPAAAGGAGAGAGGVDLTRAPTTAAELVAHFNALPRPAELRPTAASGAGAGGSGSGGGSTGRDGDGDGGVPNDWLLSVHKVELEASDAAAGADAGAADDGGASLYLWLFHAPSQRAHIERLPFASSAAGSSGSGRALLQMSEDELRASEAAARELAAPVALCVLKAFVEQFGRRDWSQAAAPQQQDAAAHAPGPHRLLAADETLARAVSRILQGLGVSADVARIRAPDAADARMSDAGWAQFLRKLTQAAAQR